MPRWQNLNPVIQARHGPFFLQEVIDTQQVRPWMLAHPVHGMGGRLATLVVKLHGSLFQHWRNLLT